VKFKSTFRVLVIYALLMIPLILSSCSKLLGNDDESPTDGAATSGESICSKGSESSTIFSGLSSVSNIRTASADLNWVDSSDVFLYLVYKVEGSNLTPIKSVSSDFHVNCISRSW